MNQDTIRSIAFYLPQYHAIPENDQWWGEGFTEWTNVRKALPRFEGHYQPHVPGQSGYYDLRDPAVLSAQAELARAYGIGGFCFYHYWFNGKRLLEHPFNETLASGQPDFPFCLCWANENWTRRWDGEEREVLMAQEHSHEDDLAHIENLLPAFRDPRYLRVDGKPLFLVYKTNLLPDPKKTAQIWRQAAEKAGIGGLYLVTVENSYLGDAPAPVDIGFDAAVEFAPHWGSFSPTQKGSTDLFPEFQGDDPSIQDYDDIMLKMLAKPKPDFKLFRGVFPSWDNSPRRKQGPTIFIGSSPEKYAFWLSQIARYTLKNFAGDERLIFINAWNEWGEGCHLEPDQKYGTSYLEATRLALNLACDLEEAVSRIEPPSASIAFSPEKWYCEVARCYRDRNRLSSSELGVLSSAASFLQFTMIPLADQATRTQFAAALKAKDDKIAELHASLSWRVTAPLRRIYGALLKAGR